MSKTEKHDCRFIKDSQGNDICKICEIEAVESIRLNQFKKAGEKFFKPNPDSSAVFVISHYNREDKTYTCENFVTGSEKFIKATKTVYIGFTY